MLKRKQLTFFPFVIQSRHTNTEQLKKLEDEIIALKQQLYEKESEIERKLQEKDESNTKEIQKLEDELKAQENKTSQLIQSHKEEILLLEDRL